MRLSFENTVKEMFFFSVRTGDFYGVYLETLWFLYFGERSIQDLSLPISPSDDNHSFDNKPVIK